MNSTKIIQLLPSLALLSTLFIPSPAISENSTVIPPLSLLLLGDNEVTSATGRIWLDRNLGASRVATSSADSEAYGDLYQWGRLTDGHEKRSSPTTSEISTTDVPGHGEFIKTSTSPSDWRVPQNDDLWLGVSTTNNPCPSGFRLPTDTKLWDERASWDDSSRNSAGAYASPLKLVVAGFRTAWGTVSYDNIGGYYNSSTVNGTNACYLIFNSTSSSVGCYHRAIGRSVRCIKD